MPVVICPDPQTVSAEAAAVVAAAIRRNPRLVLGLAAGATPVGMYRELVRLHASGLDFSGVRVFGLDEYLGLPADHPAGFLNGIRRDFLSGVNVAPENVHWPDGQAKDVAPACAAYEGAIAACGGIDLQILGIGNNGHIAFNEPGSSLGGRTRPVRLSAATRQANRKAFTAFEDVPEAALTQGVGTILAARRILLLATGEAKAPAVAAAVEGPVTAMLPASALQLHPDAAVFADTAAAGLLQRREDYAAEADMLRRMGMLG